MIFRYWDNSSFEGQWENAPGWGVQTIAFDHPIKGASLRHQGDFYREGEHGDVVRMDERSLLIWLVEDLKTVKVGAMLDSSQWEAVYNAGKVDRDSLRKPK